MIRILLTSLLFCLSINVFSFQEDERFEIEQKDSTIYNKNSNISVERDFPDNLRDKYTGDDFEYIENKTPESKPKQDNSSPILEAIFKAIVFFLQTIFPFLLGAFVLYLILKFAFGFDFKGFRKKSKEISITEKLLQEDEDIADLDLEALLNNAIKENNYRLAIRYYYLLILKQLSVKKIIKYDKDKTNSEYEFEITNQKLRKEFSYLSYIYAYVWYGEFSLDENDFKSAKDKYQTFLNSL